MSDEEKNEQPEEQKPESEQEAEQEKPEPGQEPSPEAAARQPAEEKPEGAEEGAEEAKTPATEAAEKKEEEEPAAEKAKDAMRKTEQELSAFAAKYGVKRTPVNLCKAVLAIGLILYFFSSSCVRLSNVRAQDKDSTADLAKLEYSEARRDPTPPDQVPPPNPERNLYKRAFRTLEDDEVKIDEEALEAEKEWYKEEKETVDEKMKEYMVGPEKKHARKLYEMEKTEYRRGKSQKEQIGEMELSARKARAKAGPDASGVYLRYFSLLLVLLGSFGIVVLGSDVEKAGALVLVGFVLWILSAAVMVR